MTTTKVLYHFGAYTLGPSRAFWVVGVTLGKWTDMISLLERYSLETLKFDLGAIHSCGSFGSFEVSMETQRAKSF